MILNITRTTVKRKLDFLAKRSKERHAKLIEKLKGAPVKFLQFDDLITTEHTKLKPLTVSIALDASRRIILGVEVSKIPAFGPLSRLSKIKYGSRPNHHKKGLFKLFNSIKTVVDQSALIKSDDHKFYPGIVKKFFQLCLQKI